jgi:hypothetical protein
MFIILFKPLTILDIFWLCCRLHENVESMAILSPGHDDGRRKRDAIILSFRDAKISVLEFDDSIHGLRTRYTNTICSSNLLFYILLLKATKRRNLNYFV